MGCLVKFLMLPVYFLIYSVAGFLWLIVFACQFMGKVFEFLGSFSRNRTYTYTIRSRNSWKNNKAKVVDVSCEDREFEKEAKLWGLSEEDKRIAKEERMSPADYVEAEERDDDGLVTDEWESK